MKAPVDHANYQVPSKGFLRIAGATNGGKSRFASTQIWAKLGNPVVYVEPFAGSLACLLARPDGAGQREIVCDLDGGISNFWRAVTAEPELVAYWADYPTLHADLTARHKWLRAWFAEHSAELSNDPHFYCAKVAGWWVWGISLWIGGGWCNAVSSTKEPSEQRPAVSLARRGKPGGAGVSAQKVNRPYATADPQRVWDVLPAVTSGNPLAESVRYYRRVGAGATGADAEGGATQRREWRIRARNTGAKRER